jgi:hypothetical protein
MDPKSDAAIAKKRQFTEERAERLRDARQRHMGIDRVALDEQVKEKQAMRELEKQRDAFYDKQAIQMDRHATLLQAEVDSVRRSRNVEVEGFRQTYQRKDMGREWDLNNPRRIVDSLPARVSDTDPRCGPSSAQAFAGEDLAGAERRRAQMRQLNRWAGEQMEEKAVRKWNEADIDRQYDERAEEIAHRTYLLEQHAAEQRKRMAVTTAHFNRELAEQKRREEHQRKQRDTSQKLEEMQNTVTSGFMVEDVDAPRARADFKGMTPAQLAQVRLQQEAQRVEAANRRLAEAEDERRRDAQAAMDTRMALQLDRQRDRERRAGRQQLANEHLAQAEQARATKAHLDGVYRNAIGEEFFAPLGRCVQ